MKDCYFHIVANKVVILSTLPANLLDIPDNNLSGFHRWHSPHYVNDIVYIKKETENGYVFICSTDKTITRKILQHYFDALFIMHTTYIDRLKTIKAHATSDIRRLQHNVTDYNAAIRDDLSSLFSLEDNTQADWEGILLKMEEAISRDIKKTALVLQKTHKNTTLIKAELIVHDLMYDENPRLEIFSHSIHKIVKLSFQPYFLDFLERNIHLHWAECYEKVLVDYPSISVVLGHIWNNAIKYTHENSSISIDFIKKDKEIVVRIKMLSLYIEEDEKQKIFEEGYSGKWAKLLHWEGHGIGMYYIKKLVGLNKGNFFMEPGKDKVFYDSIPYAWNTMNIQLQLAEQI